MTRATATGQLSLLDMLEAGTACQRWTRGTHTWRHTSEGGFDPRHYRVAPIDEAAARTFVLTHHYSGAYPAASLRVGLISGDSLVGVAVLGVPMSRAVLTGPFPGLEPYRQSLELSRLVLLDEVPANAESWFVSRVFDYAAGEGVRGVVAFSDPLPRLVAGEVLMPGHIGTVYKALNAVYTGRATARTLTVLPNGCVFSDRARAKVTGGERGADAAVRQLATLGAAAPSVPIRELGATVRQEWLSTALRTLGARTVRHHGNHRYVWAIGNRSARRTTRIALEGRPYPTAVDVA